MGDIKTTNLRLPLPTHGRLKTVCELTRIPMNEVIVMCIDSVLDMITATPDTPPSIVMMARAALQASHAQMDDETWLRLTEKKVSEWEAVREAVFRIERERGASAAELERVGEHDRRMRKFRELIDGVRADDAKAREVLRLLRDTELSLQDHARGLRAALPDPLAEPAKGAGHRKKQA